MRLITKALTTAVLVTATIALTAPAGLARGTWDTTPVHVTHRPAHTPHTVDLRVGKHAAYDRVVIDLTGAIPGYHVAYTKTLTYDPSGQKVPLKGARFITIRLTPASAHDASGKSVYAGPQLQQYSWPTLRGVAFTGDTEGVVSFGLALSHTDTFRVFELQAPNRLVIDLHH